MDWILITAFLSSGLSKLLYCLAIIFISFLIIKISGKVINTFFGTRLTNLRVDAKKAATLSALLCSIVRYGIIFVAACSILMYLGVPAPTLTAVLGTGTVAIGLAAQNVIKDSITGFFILLENQFSVGDLITIEGITGTVEAITIRTTLIRGFDGTLHIIPNGSISMVSNMCKGYMNAIVHVDVAYKEDIKRVIDVLNDEMEIAEREIGPLIARPAVSGIVDFGTSGVTIRIVAQCLVKENGPVERELRLRIKNRFDRENIEIPFPQTTIHMAKTQED